MPPRKAATKQSKDDDTAPETLPLRPGVLLQQTSRYMVNELYAGLSISEIAMHHTMSLIARDVSAIKDVVMQLAKKENAGQTAKTKQRAKPARRVAKPVADESSDEDSFIDDSDEQEVSNGNTMRPRRLRTHQVIIDDDEDDNNEDADEVDEGTEAHNQSVEALGALEKWTSSVLSTLFTSWVANHPRNVPLTRVSANLEASAKSFAAFVADAVDEHADEIGQEQTTQIKVQIGSRLLQREKEYLFKKMSKEYNAQHAKPKRSKTAASPDTFDSSTVSHASGSFTRPVNQVQTVTPMSLPPVQTRVTPNNMLSRPNDESPMTRQPMRPLSTNTYGQRPASASRKRKSPPEHDARSPKGRAHERMNGDAP